MKKVIIPCFAVLLAACSTDELPTGGGTESPPQGEVLTSGTVNFTNHTSLTIGSAPAQSRAAFLARGAKFDFEGNEACTLDMIDVAENEQASKVEDTQYDSEGQVADIKDISGEDVIICSGVESRIGVLGFQYARNLNKTVFVHGTFSVNNVKSNGNGRIVVYKGGVLNYNMASLDGITIVCYEGGTVNFLDEGITIGADSKVYVYGDMNLGTGDLNLGGKLYVGGNLTCETLTSTTDGAQLHVIGNVDVNPVYNGAGNVEEGTGAVTLENQVDVCVEGAMTVYCLSASKGANVHADCKLEATDALQSSINITNGAVLCAAYVKTELLHVSGGMSGDMAYVYISDGGVIDVDKLNLGNSMLLAAHETDKALVSAHTVTIENRVTWEQIIDPTLYVNYEELWADADPVDQTKHNISTINTDEVQCNPGFTVDDGGDEPGPGPDDPEEPTPGEGDNIVLEVPTWVVDDYTLRADDFAIRVNGEYLENLVVEGNTASLGDIRIVDDQLTLTVSGLSEENILEGNDYTYEVWLWVNNHTLLNDGTGGYGPLFDALKYAEWVNPENDPYADDPYGCDITSLLEDENVYSPAGYVVRYNVYRGLSGHVDSATGYGDTPYIKVSIHVQRDATAAEDTNVGVYPQLAQ